MSLSIREIFERLGTSEEFWFERIKKMLTSKSLRGRYFAGEREKIRDIAAARGQHHLANRSLQPSD